EAAPVTLTGHLPPSPLDGRLWTVPAAVPQFTQMPVDEFRVQALAVADRRRDPALHPPPPPVAAAQADGEQRDGAGERAADEQRSDRPVDRVVGHGIAGVGGIEIDAHVLR